MRDARTAAPEEGSLNWMPSAGRLAQTTTAATTAGAIEPVEAQMARAILRATPGSALVLPDGVARSIEALEYAASRARMRGDAAWVQAFDNARARLRSAGVYFPR